MKKSVRHILVTGANGFIGKNLMLRIKESTQFSPIIFVRGDKIDTLPTLLEQVDAVVHLAGENRPENEVSFSEVNTDLTVAICDAIHNEYKKNGRKIGVLLSSSVQAELDNAYGLSKLAAEKAVQELAENTGCPVVIYRLPGVFGKWSKPYYNSVVATFCHNIANDFPNQIIDPLKCLNLVHVDDVVNSFLNALTSESLGVATGIVEPEYAITVGQLADQINAFKICRTAALQVERVGVGLTRKLYSTYLTFMPTKDFSYKLPQYQDPRGKFFEVLKTYDSGQFNFFTAVPGITRGGHYHHNKSEKFLVVKGNALFRFRNLITNELFELKTSDSELEIVDTVPGWAHDITNVGNEDLLVMLWANENFDSSKPDTFTSTV